MLRTQLLVTSGDKDGGSIWTNSGVCTPVTNNWCTGSYRNSLYTSYRNSLYTSYRGNEYPKQVTGRLTRYPGVVIAVVNRDTNSSSAGSRMSNVLVAAKLGMRRLFVAQ